jgi:hypothetical protein
MTDIRTAAQWGTWVTAGVLILVLYRAQGLTAPAGDPGVQRAAYLTTVGAWAATAWLLAWRPPRAWQRRAPAAALGAATIGATAAVSLAAPAGLQHTTANWAVGANGWLLLTITFGAPMSLVLLSLTGQVAFAMAVAVSAGPPEIVLFTARALGILGLQVPIALAARALERLAETTRELHLTREAIRTEQFVAAALHDDRLRRSRAVAAAVEPVLARLATGGPVAEPDDILRRHSGVAAAQVRRLLTEWHRCAGDPLGADLSACLDELQAAGTRVEVAVHADGLPPVLRRGAGDLVRAVARLSAARLRLTVVPAATRLCLSVVAEVGGAGPRFVPPDVPAPLTIRTTTVGGTLWVELTCPV